MRDFCCCTTRLCAKTPIPNGSRKLTGSIQSQTALARSYATEAPKQGGTNPAVYALGAAAVGGGAYYFLSANPGAAQKAAEKAKAVVPSGPAKKAFTGGDQGFVSLPVEEVEIINHNTKRIRFKLPEEDMVSGLDVASAILTKYKYEDQEKPVLRPYTPTSDEGESTCCSGHPVISKV